MSKNTNLSFLTDYITADITNGRIGINNASPTVAFDVVGATKITGVLTLTSTISNGTYAYTLPSATGTLALTSALSSYLPLTGGTLTGALGGTSATFSSNIAIGAGTQAINGDAELTLRDGINFVGFDLKSARTSGNLGGIRFFGTSSDSDPVSQILAETDGKLVFYNGSLGAVPRLTIASTGAATFSSSVTVNGSSVSTEGLSVQYNQAKTYTTQTAVSRWHSNESSGSQFKLNLFAIGNATGSSRVFSFQTSNEGVANDGIISLQAGGGNVGIGTTSPSSLLNTYSATTATQITITGADTTNQRLEVTDGTVTNRFGIFGRTNGDAGTIGTQTNHSLVFNTNNTERMRITSAGNVGIGATSVTASTNYKMLKISGTSGAEFTLGTTSTDVGYIYANTGDFVISALTAIPLTFQTNSTTRMVITSAGNLGIGTSTPTDSIIGTGTFLDIASTGGGALKLHYTNATAVGELSFYKGSNGSYIDSAGAATLANNDLIFRTGGTASNYGVSERMRITSGGFTKISNTGTYQNSTGTYHEIISNQGSSSAVTVNHTSNSAPYGITIYYPNATPNNSTNEFLYCFDSTNSKFIIASSGSATNRTGSYGTISDIKFKENIVDATPKLSDLMNLKVRNFNLKGETTKHIGFIAQEFEEVFPAMVDVSKEKDSEETYKSIKTSVLIPMLVKAIQELSAEITILKQK